MNNDWWKTTEYVNLERWFELVEAKYRPLWEKVMLRLRKQLRGEGIATITVPPPKLHKWVAVVTISYNLPIKANDDGWVDKLFRAETVRIEYRTTNLNEGRVREDIERYLWNELRVKQGDTIFHELERIEG